MSNQFLEGSDTAETLSEFAKGMLDTISEWEQADHEGGSASEATST